MPPRATITDVATTAGVALGTVSRVLNNHVDVNPEIRDRVLAVARKLGYQRLRQRRSAGVRAAARNGAVGTVAVVIFGMEDTLVQLPVISSALQGIERALSATGRSLMLANIASGDRLPPFLEEGNVQGLILKGPNQGLLPDAASHPLLRQLYRLPRVWLMGRLPNARGDHCNFDTEIAGRLVAEHLAAKGHHRVAYMNPKPGQAQFERVKTAFAHTCARAGLAYSLLEVDPPQKLTWPLPATTRQDNVDLLVDRWAALPAKARPTALFVPSDRTATQLYTSLARRNLRPGRDVSVVSCNNERSLIASLHPAPTTIDIHAELVGRRAVDQLLWRIANPGELVDTQVLVEPSLVEGESVATL
ncbi:MAG TPA: LacI family DNA-binding transcriptional regulator [Opitutaceae bacterium]|nr:LacI family DNA-binding transcriptional regulator [Opitutaceae bacterium]